MSLTLAVIWKPIGPNGNVVVDSFHEGKPGISGLIPAVSANDQALAKFDAIKDLPGVGFAAVVNARDIVTRGAVVIEYGHPRYMQDNEAASKPLHLGWVINDKGSDWF